MNLQVHYLVSLSLHRKIHIQHSHMNRALDTVMIGLGKIK